MLESKSFKFNKSNENNENPSSLLIKSIMDFCMLTEISSEHCFFINRKSHNFSNYDNLKSLDITLIICIIIF
jgi:hypothetical protein